MECNKDEAIRAKEIAEKKMEDNDFEGARKIALRAKNLYPELDNIAQMLSICDVHCASQKRILGSEKDWYGILQVEKLADEQTIKKQYRRLALILHPDKNRFPGAEGAFKLIYEANVLLSDPTKKSLYDNKIRILNRSASVNPPNHQINRTSQLNKQYSAQNNISNGFGTLNQHQATQPVSSARQEVFWTCCPYCKVRYQYLRQHMNRSMHCPTCSKVFITHEISPQGVFPGSKFAQQGPQHVSAKPGPSQPADIQEKVVPKQANSKMGVKNAKGPSASHTGLQGTGSRKTLQPEQDVRTRCGSEGIKVSAAGNLKTEKKDNLDANALHGGDNLDVSSLNGRREGMTSDGDPIYKEKRDMRTKSQKRRKMVVEPSEDFDADIEDLTMQGNLGEPVTDLKSKPSQAQFTRRSSRQKQHISYMETDEDDHARPFKRAQATKEDKGTEQKNAVDRADSRHVNQSNCPTAADYSKNVECDKEGKTREVTGGKTGIGADTVEIESDSDEDISSSEKADAELFDCPDPEFSDFDKVRDESQFAVNQLWACYDTLDSMPRFYAKVKKVCLSPFELLITWLEAEPINKAFEEWVEEELPVGCGSFKLGITEKTSARLSFSHQVHCEKGKKRGHLTIYPRVGETWALFKDWNMSWSSNPENHKKFKYEVVEVLSDFDVGVGIKVSYLDKVAGFVSLFQRASQSETNPCLIGPNELYKFSHCVPCFKMTGSERGVPIGSFELDPACLPLNPDDLYYPSKAETQSRNMGPGVKSSLPKYAEEKGKYMAPEGAYSPQKFVDLEGEMSKPRRSPRGATKHNCGS